MIEKLEYFGLTRLEAQIYIQLLTQTEMTGYEMAKQTGISRSNVYSSLNGLVEKGAAYMIEGEATKFTAVPVSDFLKNRISELKKKAEEIIAEAPKQQVQSTGYITVKSSRNIKNKISKMLEEVQLRLYILAESSLIEEYRIQLEKLVKEGKKVVILTDSFLLKGAKIYRTNVEKGQLRFITDSNFVLTGELTGSETDTCLYSGQNNLVEIMKEALKNKITLITGETK